MSNASILNTETTENTQATETTMNKSNNPNNVNSNNTNSNSIHLTPKAAQHLQKMLNNNPNVQGIRLGVKSSGCSGYAYVLDFAKEITDQDNVSIIDNVQIVVDKTSLNFLTGTEIDCHEDEMNQSYLKFKNPNVQGECGCGESFSVKKP